MTSDPRRAATADKNAPLIDDPRLLGRILGEVIREQDGAAAYELVERIRQPEVQRQSILAAERTIAKLVGQFGPDAIRYYIISHTEEVSDLLEVLLLFKETGLLRGTPGEGAVSELVVVPLFETISDLRRAPSIMRRFHALPGFADYFFSATPTREIAELNIGSRPAARTAAWHPHLDQRRRRGPAQYGLGAQWRCLEITVFRNQRPVSNRKERIQS